MRSFRSYSIASGRPVFWPWHCSHQLSQHIYVCSSTSRVVHKSQRRRARAVSDGSAEADRKRRSRCPRNVSVFSNVPGNQDRCIGNIELERVTARMLKLVPGMDRNDTNGSLQVSCRVINLLARFNTAAAWPFGSCNSSLPANYTPTSLSSTCFLPPSPRSPFPAFLLHTPSPA